MLFEIINALYHNNDMNDSCDYTVYALLPRQ